MLDRGLVVCNAKGGVGKSSLAAGIAATAAAFGRRTLLVDLDPHGSVDQDLGYRQSGQSDDGRSLYEAAVDGEPIAPLRDVRTGLDVIAAGDFTQAVFALTQAGDTMPLDLAAHLEQAGEGYDLVVIDTPPATTVALDIALCASRFMLLPVSNDTGSLDGLELVSDRYQILRGRGVNTALQPLGVVLFGMDPSQPRLHREVRADVTWELDGVAPVLDAFIRHASRAARDMRLYGVVAGEYLRAARDALTSSAGLAGADSFDLDAEGLAQDYWDLTAEVLGHVDHLTARPVIAETPLADPDLDRGPDPELVPSSGSDAGPGSRTVIDLRGDVAMRHRPMRGRPREGALAMWAYRDAPAILVPRQLTLHERGMETEPATAHSPVVGSGAAVAFVAPAEPAADTHQDSGRRRFLVGDLVVRHVKLRSVARVSLAFYLCLLAAVLVAGAVLWNMANRAGWVTNWTGFLVDIGFTSANVQGPAIFQASLLAGLILVATATALTLAAAVMYNQISGLVGGIEMSLRSPRRSRRVRRSEDGMHAVRPSRRRRRLGGRRRRSSH